MEHIEESRAKRFERRAKAAQTALVNRDRNRRQDTCLALVKLTHAVEAGKSRLRTRDLKCLDDMIDELDAMVMRLHAQMYREAEYAEDIVFPDDDVTGEDEGETEPSETAEDVQSDVLGQEEGQTEVEASAPAEGFKTTPTEVPTALPKDNVPVMPEAPVDAAPVEQQSEAETDGEPDQADETQEAAASDEPEADEGPEWDAPSDDEQRAYNDMMNDAIGKGNISVE